MLSTGAMTRLGYVYGNLMVNLHTKNKKLTERGVGILENATGLDRRTAGKLLAVAGGRVPVAMVMAKAGVSRADAAVALKQATARCAQRLHCKAHITLGGTVSPVNPCAS